MYGLVFLLTSGLGLGAMMLNVGFRRLSRVVCGVMKMPLCGVRVVRRRFVVARFMVLGRFTMVPSCVFMMFGSLAVMLCSLLGHLFLLFSF